MGGEVLRDKHIVSRMMTSEYNTFKFKVLGS